MRIGIAQLNTRAGDYGGSASRMEAAARKAFADGAELLLFPSIILTGPVVVEYASVEPNMTDLYETLSGLAHRVEVPCIVPLLLDVEGSSLPEIMLLSDGEVLPLCLSTYVADSLGQRTPLGAERREGSTAVTFELLSKRFGVAFDYGGLEDLRNRDRLDIVLFIPTGSYALDDDGSVLGAALADNRFPDDAMALDAWFVAVGPLGGSCEQVFTGSSFVLSPKGELVASSPAFEEAMLMAEVGGSPEEVEATLEPEIYNRTLHLWEALSLSLHDHLEKSGETDVALIMDGSLGTSALAVLASDALGPRHVHVLVSAPRQTQRHQVARSIIDALHIEARELADLGRDVDELFASDVANAHLAAFARGQGALILSSEDKTHLALEARLSVCRCAALLPFGDVYRTDLIELAHLRNTISPVIPAEAFAAYGVPDIEGLSEAEPNDEMRLRRVDVTLATHIEWERDLTDTIARQGAPAVTEAILSRLRATEQARLTLPPVLAVSSRTLADAEMPVPFAWRDHARDGEERFSTARLMERTKELLASSAGTPDLAASLAGQLLEGLGLEGASGRREFVQLDRDELTRSVGDVLGLLQDLLQSGGLSQERPSGDNPLLGGPTGPLTWGSPFSEN